MKEGGIQAEEEEKSRAQEGVEKLRFLRAEEERSDMAPKRALRRPAVAPRAPRIRARPAGRVEEMDDWQPAAEVNVWEVNSWSAILVQGLYWDNNAELIGVSKGVEVNSEGTWISLKAHGTTSEPLLRMLSGQPGKLVKIHLCDDPCRYLTWSETVIHASRIKKCSFEDYAWSRNAEVSVREAERDEMEILRREAAERGKGVGAPRVAPGETAVEAGDDKPEEVKKDSKKWGIPAVQGFAVHLGVCS